MSDRFRRIIGLQHSPVGLSLVIAVLAMHALGTMTARGQTFRGLGVLSGGTSSIASGVSASGSVVVGQADKGALGDRAFRWTSAGGMVNLGLFPGAAYTRAIRCSADGSVVVGYGGTVDGTQRWAFRWTSGTGFVNLGRLPGGLRSTAIAANTDGSVIVGWSDRSDGIQRAIRWTSAGGLVDLGTVSAGDFSLALCVSQSGSIVAGFSNPYARPPRALRWTIPGGITDLGSLPGGAAGVEAVAMNNDGSVIVGTSDSPSTGGQQGFRWTSQTGMIGLGLPAGTGSSYATDISGDGSIILGFTETPSPPATPTTYAPFLWTRTGGFQDLLTYFTSLGINPTGWTISDVSHLSADGRTIMGNGVHNGRAEGWIATIPARCAADFNGSGGLSVQDIFDFLSAWIADDPRADFNGVNGFTNQDIFDYLAAWFAGC